MRRPIGELLKEWRRQNKLTGECLARRAGISRTTLTRWEAGQTQPRMVELEAVLTALGATAVQRQEALSCMEAPRAVKLLRDVVDVRPPVSGDLLRAMRLRRGWTQQETAKRAGIAQGTLARWERSDDWPSAERLHTLCYVLQAQEAELVALTCGLLLTAKPPLQTTLDREAARAIVSRYMFYAPLADVEFLALEALLWRLSRKEKAAYFELSYTYGCHARFLAEQHRFAEAAVYVARIHQLGRSGYRDDIGWSAAVIAESRIAGMGGRTPRPERAVKILRTWVDDPFLTERKEYQAWMHSEIAGYLLKMGEPDSALTLGRQAIGIAEEVDTSEPWWRRGDYARVLVQAGQYGAALEECCAYLNMGYVPLEDLPFLLTGAQALAGLERVSEAADWLCRMDGIIATHPQAAHYCVSAESLRQRL